MKITRVSQMTRVEHTLDLNVTREQMKRFDNRRENGEYVQDIFPDLNRAEREFILTGVSPKEWEETFGKSPFEN